MPRYDERLLAQLAAHKAERPDFKCAVEGCRTHYQTAWEKIAFTPAPEGWTCSQHQAVDI